MDVRGLGRHGEVNSCVRSMLLSRAVSELMVLKKQAGKHFKDYNILHVLKEA